MMYEMSRQNVQIGLPLPLGAPSLIARGIHHFPIRPI